MEEQIKTLENLIQRGEQLINIIPKKSEYLKREKAIKNKYKDNEPLVKFGSDLLSLGAAEITSEIFGQRKIGRNYTSNKIKNQYLAQRDQEIDLIELEYRSSMIFCKSQYSDWFSDSLQVIEKSKCKPALKKLMESKYKQRLESKIKNGLIALNQSLQYQQVKSLTEATLIKTGEPLKGRKIIKDFLHNAQTYVKIQDPYPSPELLELIEDLPTNINSILLIGSFNNARDEEKFQTNLDLLRKCGRSVYVYIMKCPEKAPFHDRFILTRGTGLHLGTSLSGIGLRDSAITQLSNISEIEARFDFFCKNSIEHRGSKYYVRQL